MFYIRKASETPQPDSVPVEIGQGLVLDIVESDSTVEFSPEVSVLDDKWEAKVELCEVIAQKSRFSLPYQEMAFWVLIDLVYKGRPFDDDDNTLELNQGEDLLIHAGFPGLCTCGKPELLLRDITDALKCCYSWIDDDTAEQEAVAFRREYYGKTSVGERSTIVASVLEHHGFLDYGGSIYGAWLTGKGVLLKSAIHLWDNIKPKGV